MSTKIFDITFNFNVAEDVYKGDDIALRERGIGVLGKSLQIVYYYTLNSGIIKRKKKDGVHTMKLILSDRPLPLEIPDHADVKWIDLSQLKIANCVGCYGCWTKTPGQCVIRDDATKVYPLIAQSDAVLYVSRIQYGGYDTVMKTMLERAIPVQQAFIRIHDGETHHVQRRVTPKTATILAYGDPDEEEREIFRQLIARNAHNMSFASYRILFCKEDEVYDFVRREVETWGI